MGPVLYIDLSCSGKSENTSAYDRRPAGPTTAIGLKPMETRSQAKSQARMVYPDIGP